MKTATTPKVVSAVVEPVLCVALELSAPEWKMAFSPGLGQQPRHRVVRAGDLPSRKTFIRPEAWTAPHPLQPIARRQLSQSRAARRRRLMSAATPCEASAVRSGK